MLVDSHCHLHMLDLTAYENQLSLLIKESETHGVKSFLTVGVDVASSEAILKIAKDFSNVYSSVGVHPSDSIQADIDWQHLESLALHSKVIAIGETGLDYYYNETGLDIQREVFRKHIQLACKVNKPLIIHSRQAREDTIQILKEEGAAKVKGVMHCFTESWEMAEQALALGFYISFSGIITFKNAIEVADVAKKVPLERLLIETDAPYLTPVPYRGKPNKPYYVRYVAEKIAELKQLSFDQVAAQTTQNFYDLFFP